MSYLLFLLFGVYAILSALSAVDGVVFSAWLVYLTPVLTGTLLWIAYYKVKNRWFFRGTVLAELLLCGGYTAVCFDSLKEQAIALFACLTGEVIDETVTITSLAVLFGALLTLLFFGFELILKSHIILYILTTLLLILTPMLRVRLSVFDLAMLFLFQFFFWGLTWGEHRQKSDKSSRQARTLWVALPAVFVLAVGLAVYFQDALFNLSYEIEGDITRTINQETGAASVSVANGRISGGNRYQTGTEQLSIHVSRMPEQSLYLRGFGGGTYTGGNWTRSSDEALFNEMMDELDWVTSRTDIAERYYQMYYTMNLESGGATEDDLLQIQIWHSTQRFMHIYMPYYATLQVEWYKQQPSVDEFTLAFNLFEQSDMHVNWDNVPEDFAEERDKYAELQTAYMEQIQTAYTEVPEEKLPRLVEFVEENPLTGLDDITAFILYTLSTNCTYSLTPGWAPINEDIVEYFLFDSGKGYCQHFAAAATLMYRLYGIPARYASGYRADPSIFTESEYGGYDASLTDENAHAWVEIFLPDYGWTPVEVTPSATGEMGAAYPGFDSSSYEEILSEYHWDQNPLSWLSQVGSSLGSGGSSEANDDWERLTEFSQEETLTEDQLRDLLSILLVVLIYGVLFVPLILDARRARLIRRRKGESPRVTFDRLIRMLHYCGILQEYQGSEPDFSDRLLERISSVTPAEWEKFYDLVSQIAYGKEADADAAVSDVEAGVYAQEIYRKIEEELLKSLGWWEKQIFLYVRVFGCQADDDK